MVAVAVDTDTAAVVVAVDVVVDVVLVVVDVVLVVEVVVMLARVVVLVLVLVLVLLVVEDMKDAIESSRPAWTPGQKSEVGRHPAQAAMTTAPVCQRRWMAAILAFTSSAIGAGILAAARRC